MAPYLPIDHGDIEEFLAIGSDNHPIQDMNSGVIVDSPWMQSMIDGDSEKRRIWGKLLQARKETGYPYLMFRTNANNQAPEVFRDKNLTINSSNLCVTGDTLVLTREGYKPIDSLVGLTVDCWNGQEWSSTPIFQTSEGQHVVTVELSNGQTIQATPYHKWYVAKQNSFGGLTGEEMKRTYELQPGDKLVKFDLSPVTHGTAELSNAYANGFHSADGTMCNGDNARIALYDGKKALVPWFTGYRSITEDSSGRLNVNYASDVLYPKFWVPSSDYSVKSRLDWFAGYVDGDGTLTNNNGTESIQIGSINKGFLLEIQLLLQELGVNSKVSLMRKACYTKLPTNDGTGNSKEYWCEDAYRLLIAGSELNHLLSLGFAPKRVVPTVRNYNRKASQFVKVVSVTDDSVIAPTYCGTEPIRNRLMFNGVLTGNCNEIYLPSTPDESFTCILSSMNLLHYDEWKDTDAVETLVYFLDAVATEFITKLEAYRDSPNRDDQLVWEYMKRAHRFTVNNRA
jgi:ribonucleoside-diphosphate reductase alpha chain